MNNKFLILGILIILSQLSTAIYTANLYSDATVESNHFPNTNCYTWQVSYGYGLGNDWCYGYSDIYFVRYWNYDLTNLSGVIVNPTLELYSTCWSGWGVYNVYYCGNSWPKNLSNVTWNNQPANSAPWQNNITSCTIMINQSSGLPYDVGYIGGGVWYNFTLPVILSSGYPIFMIGRGNTTYGGMDIQGYTLFYGNSSIGNVTFTLTYPENGRNLFYSSVDDLPFKAIVNSTITLVNITRVLTFINGSVIDIYTTPTYGNGVENVYGSVNLQPYGNGWYRWWLYATADNGVIYNTTNSYTFQVINYSAPKKQCWGNSDGTDNESEVIYFNITTLEKYSLSELNNSEVYIMYCYNVPSSFGSNPFRPNSGTYNQLNYYNGNNPCEVMAYQITSNYSTLFRVYKFYLCNSEIKEVLIGAENIPLGYKENIIYRSVCNAIDLNQNITEIIYLTKGNVSQLKLLFQDLNTKNNLSNVYVSIDNGLGSYPYVTNESGSLGFTITNLAEYTILGEKDGYLPHEIKLSITEFKDYSQTIYLASLNGSLYNLTGYVLDSNNIGIANCNIKSDCKYKMGVSDSYEYTATATVLTDSNGLYKLISTQPYLSTCIITSDCLNYYSDYFSYVVINNSEHNFTLNKKAPEIRVYGYVKDEMTGNYISGATITVTNWNNLISEYKTISDSKGFYDVKAVVGNNTLECVALDYIANRYIVEINGELKHDFLMISSQNLKWLRGKCVLEDNNYNQIPVNCSIMLIKDNNVVNTIQSSRTEIGYFSTKTYMGAYTLRATYKGNTLTQNIYLKDDMDFNNIIFKFTSQEEGWIYFWSGISATVLSLGGLIAFIILLLVLKVIETLME